MFKNVLVPIDLAEPDFSRKAVELALREAEQNGAKLHFMTVVQGYNNALVASYFSESDHKKAVEAVAKELKQWAEKTIPSSVDVTLRVYEGQPAESVLYYAKKRDIDLIIMAAHNRSRVNEFLMGSTSHRVVDRSSCSVLVLRD